MTTQYDPELTAGEFELDDRRALRRVAGLSTELEDITEVEYRQLQLERVVLVGVWTGGSATEAENSLAELAALTETAGAQVMEALAAGQARSGHVHRLRQGDRAPGRRCGHRCGHRDLRRRADRIATS